jgi:hypothetical protein
MKLRLCKPGARVLVKDGRGKARPAVIVGVSGIIVYVRTNDWCHFPVHYCRLREAEKEQ